MIRLTVLRLWRLLLSMFIFRIFPDEIPQVKDKKEKEIVTTSGIASTTSATVQTTTALGTAGSSGETHTTSQSRPQTLENPFSSLVPQQLEDSENEETYTTYTVGWVYHMKKKQLIEELHKLNINTEGTTNDLRKRFVRFLRRKADQRPETYYGGGFQKFGQDIAQALPQDTWCRKPQSRPILQPEGHLYNPLLEEATSIREILNLSPNTDANTVKRILTSITKGPKVDESETPINPPSELQGMMFPRQTLSTATNVSFATEQNRYSLDVPPPKPTGQINKQRYWTPPNLHQISESEDSSARSMSQINVCKIVRKWNLTYDGDRDPISFLERLEELMECYHISSEDILKALPELLKSKALLWYRNNREFWTNFDDFLESFQIQYLPPGYKRNLQDEIRLRTQGEDEPFRSFVVNLCTLIRRSGGYSLEEKLDRIYCNMRPEYKLTLKRQSVKSLSEIIKEAESYESYVREKNLFKSPPNPAQALVPETAYYYKSKFQKAYPKTSSVNIEPPNTNTEHVQPQRNSSWKGTAKETPRSFQKYHRNNQNSQSYYNRHERSQEPQTAEQKNRDTRRVPICWNCDEEGHRYNECEKPKVLKCFNCKKEGVRTTECNCNRGNGSRVPETGGQLRSTPENPTRPPTNGKPGSKN